MTRTATMEAPAGVGHNNPPADPFTAISAHIQGLYDEAKNWADGTPIANQAQADELSRLIDDIRKAEKAADEARIAEKKPLDDQVLAVQTKWGALIADNKGKRGLTVLALEACKAALRPWLEAVEAENRRKAEEARQAAARAAQAAADAVRAAQASSDLEAREKAEALVTEAREADTFASHAETTKAHATGGERAIGLRDNWIPKLTDGQAALRHYWATNRPALESCALDLAKTDVRAGKRSIPGFEIVNERRI